MSEKNNNVLGEPLEICGEEPLTGFFRDGSCRTDKNDYGSHTVCARVTEEFLEFSKTRGNDLKTPRPDLNFQGLKILYLFLFPQFAYFEENQSFF